MLQLAPSSGNVTKIRLADKLSMHGGDLMAIVTSHFLTQSLTVAKPLTEVYAEGELS